MSHHGWAEHTFYILVPNEQNIIVDSGLEWFCAQGQGSDGSPPPLFPFLQLDVELPTSFLLELFCRPDVNKYIGFFIL